MLQAEEQGHDQDVSVQLARAAPDADIGRRCMCSRWLYPLYPLPADIINTPNKAESVS